ncbi:MAG TPA: hypothetical protein VNT79_13260 [Phycisphaerae bacterium]|nr:hypothetical protein [Phycisphaerae bacterium]
MPVARSLKAGTFRGRSRRQRHSVFSGAVWASRGRGAVTCSARATPSGRGAIAARAEVIDRAADNRGFIAGAARGMAARFNTVNGIRDTVARFNTGAGARGAMDVTQVTTSATGRHCTAHW